MISFFYGADETYIDISDCVSSYCTYGDEVFIPAGDVIRAKVFSDPICNVVKNIVVFQRDNGKAACKCYGAETNVSIQLNGEQLGTGSGPLRDSPITAPPAEMSAEDKIAFVHGQLQFTGGSLQAEWNEQLMAVNYLDPDAKVLEIGANIGRNTLMISALLNDDRNFVTLECDPNSVDFVRQNRFINKRHFYVEPSALSYQKLMQRGWVTVPSNELLPGYKWVNTITWEDLMRKYVIEFDTLVLDCEGAIFYILQDNPRILDNISTILLESDFHSAEQKAWVDNLFRSNGLEKVYSEPLVGAESQNFAPECSSSFYEVWKQTELSR